MSEGREDGRPGSSTDREPLPLHLSVLLNTLSGSGAAYQHGEASLLSRWAEWPWCSGCHVGLSYAYHMRVTERGTDSLPGGWQ